MSNKNYRSGYGLEYRYLKSLIDSKEAKRGARFFRSVGPIWKKDFERMNDKGSDWLNKHAPVDIWWIDKDNFYHEAQCKYSKNTVGRISEEEFLELVEYAMENPDKSIHLVSKKGKEHKIHVWTFKNAYVD